MSRKSAAQAETTDEERFAACVDALIKLQDTEGWKVLMMKLEADAEAALYKLAEIDADDVKAMRKQQNIVARFNWYADAPSEMIQEGMSEEELLGLNQDGLEEEHEDG